MRLKYGVSCSRQYQPLPALGAKQNGARRLGNHRGRRPPPLCLGSPLAGPAVDHTLDRKALSQLLPLASKEEHQTTTPAHLIHQGEAPEGRLLPPAMQSILLPSLQRRTILATSQQSFEITSTGSRSLLPRCIVWCSITTLMQNWETKDFI